MLSNGVFASMADGKSSAARCVTRREQRFWNAWCLAVSAAYLAFLHGKPVANRHSTPAPSSNSHQNFRIGRMSCKPGAALHREADAHQKQQRHHRTERGEAMKCRFDTRADMNAEVVQAVIQAMTTVEKK